MARLHDKVALITGAASGMGAATARMFAAEGASVAIADLQEEAGNALADELGDAGLFARCDVSIEADVAGAVQIPPVARAFLPVPSRCTHRAPNVGGMPS